MRISEMIPNMLQYCVPVLGVYCSVTMEQEALVEPDLHRLRPNVRYLYGHMCVPFYTKDNLEVVAWYHSEMVSQFFFQTVPPASQLG